jgi:hypothetical protein
MVMSGFTSARKIILTLAGVKAQIGGSKLIRPKAKSPARRA